MLLFLSSAEPANLWTASILLLLMMMKMGAVSRGCGPHPISPTLPPSLFPSPFSLSFSSLWFTVHGILIPKKESLFYCLSSYAGLEVESCCCCCNSRRNFLDVQLLLFKRSVATRDFEMSLTFKIDETMFESQFRIYWEEQNLRLY